MRKLLLMLLAIAGVATAQKPSKHDPVWSDTLMMAQVTVSDGTQVVFNQSMRIARAAQVEIGGCAVLQRRKGTDFYVDNAWVSYTKTAKEEMWILCSRGLVSWHTHFDIAHEGWVQGLPSVQDAQTEDFLGVIVYGIGPDSLTPYGWTKKTQPRK